MLNLVMPVEICICLKISDQMHTHGKKRPHPKTKNNIASHVYFWRNFTELIINPIMIFCKLFHASFVQRSRLVCTQVKSTLSTLYVASGAFALISIVEMFFWFWRFSKSFLPEASFGLRVLSLPVSVCVCVSVSVRQPPACPRGNSSSVQARITKFVHSV